MTADKAHRATNPIDPIVSDFISQWWLDHDPKEFRQGLEHGFLGLALSKKDYYVVNAEGEYWPLADILKMDPAELRDGLKSIEADTAGPHATYERMKLAAAWAGYAMEHFIYEMPAPGSALLPDEQRSSVIDAELNTELSLWFYRGMATLRQHDRAEQNQSGEFVFKAHKTLPRPTDESPARDDFWRAFVEDRLHYRLEHDKLFSKIREDYELERTGIVPADLSRPAQADKIRGSFEMLQEVESNRILGVPRQEYQPGSHKSLPSSTRRDRDDR